MSDEEKGRKKKGIPTILIQKDWCKKCGICIEFCPAMVFTAREDGFPLITNPDNCTWCEMCELRCPDLAITLKEKSTEEAT